MGVPGKTTRNPGAVQFGLGSKGENHSIGPSPFLTLMPINKEDGTQRDKSPF